MEVEAAQSPEGRNPEKPACLPHGTQKAGALGGSHSEGQQEQETAQPQSPSPQPPAQTLLQKSSRGSPSAGWPTWRAGEHPDLGTPCPLPVLALRQENWGLLSGEGAWPREQMLDTDTARRPSEAPTEEWGHTRVIVVHFQQSRERCFRQEDTHGHCKGQKHKGISQKQEGKPQDGTNLPNMEKHAPSLATSPLRCLPFWDSSCCHLEPPGVQTGEAGSPG